MSAGIWNASLSHLRQQWQETIPCCGQADCSWLRRLWRRSQWWNGSIRYEDTAYCSPQCFESALRQSLVRLCASSPPVPAVRHRVPLGLLLLSRGQLTNPQLRAALEAQRGSGRHRLGEWLEKMGFVTEQQVTSALGLQWACPVVSARCSPDPACVRLLPYRLLESFRVLPLQFVAATRTLFLAFGEGIDYGVLYAVERMLDCHTEACLLHRSAMERWLEEVGRRRDSNDLLFEGWRGAPEMARISCGYALKLGARKVRAVGCGEYIWVRLDAGADRANLVFRRAPAAAEAG